MSKRTIYDCDRCGKLDITAARISVFTGRSTDAAGSRSNDYAEFEICLACCQFLLQKLSDKVDKADEELLQQIQACKK